MTLRLRGRIMGPNEGRAGENWKRVVFEKEGSEAC